MTAVTCTRCDARDLEYRGESALADGGVRSWYRCRTCGHTAGWDHQPTGRDVAGQDALFATDAAPTPAAREWTVELAGNPPLSLNDRQHRHQRARLVAQWRRDTALAVRAAQVPSLRAVAVTLHATPPVRRRRDSHNLSASLKAAVDGLVDALVVPDDTDRYVHSQTITIHDAAANTMRVWRWTLHIREEWTP